MKILLWGAGQDGVRLSRLYHFYGNIYNDDIVGIVDSNSNKWGEVLFGIRIVSPKYVTQLQWDKIVVASTSYFAEIKNILVTEYDVNLSDILSLRDYCNQKVIHYQYETNIKRNEEYGRCSTYQPFDKRSLVVYTAIIGDYDVLQDPLVIEKDVHYVCYTDQKEITSDIWEMRYIDEVPETERAICVRRYKMLPHKFFSEYKTSIWIDSSLKILGKLTKLLDQYQRYANFLLMPHNERVCAYEEAFVYAANLFDSKRHIIPQIAKYLQENYPQDNGLMMGGFLVRNHHDKKIIRVMEDWYLEICTYSKRDQISLPYAIWKNMASYDFCDLYIANNPWIGWSGHKHINDARGVDFLKNKERS